MFRDKINSVTCASSWTYILEYYYMIFMTIILQLIDCYTGTLNRIVIYWTNQWWNPSFNHVLLTL